MKKPQWIMIGISIAFICILLGVFLGRNLGNDYISFDNISQTVNGTTSHETNDGKTDINTATSQQLQMLPGIGETLAQRIIDYRTEAGPFEAVEDLMNVNGIGSSKLEQIRPYIKVIPVTN